MSSDNDVMQAAFEDEIRAMFTVFVDALVEGFDENVALERFRRGLAAANRAKLLLQAELKTPVASAAPPAITT